MQRFGHVFSWLGTVGILGFSLIQLLSILTTPNLPPHTAREGVVGCLIALLCGLISALCSLLSPDYPLSGVGLLLLAALIGGWASGVLVDPDLVGDPFVLGLWAVILCLSLGGGLPLIARSAWRSPLDGAAVHRWGMGIAGVGTVFFSLACLGLLITTVTAAPADLTAALFGSVFGLYGTCAGIVNGLFVFLSQRSRFCGIGSILLGGAASLILVPMLLHPLTGFPAGFTPIMGSNCVASLSLCVGGVCLLAGDEAPHPTP